MRECSGGACASGVADAQRRRRRYVSVMARMRGSGRLCASGVVGAQRRRRGCVGAMGRLCASAGVGARDSILGVNRNQSGPIEISRRISDKLG